MSGRIDSRLKELGIQLPQPATPAANYVPYTVSGNTVYVAGQVTGWKGEFRYPGKLGAGLSIEDGYQAARICGLNLIAQFRAACDGDLDRVLRVLKLGGFVNSAPDFTDQPKVLNGASDLMVEVFGDAGYHARYAVGVATLPLGVSVEVDAIIEITGG